MLFSVFSSCLLINDLFRSPECIEEIRKLHAVFNSCRAEARSAVKANIKRKSNSLQRDIEQRKRRYIHPVSSHFISSLLPPLPPLLVTLAVKKSNLY